MLTTAGDEVHVWPVSEVPALLVPIDSVDEAFMMVYLSDEFAPILSRPCDGSSEVERVGTGWRIEAEPISGLCVDGFPGDLSVLHYDVSELGKTTIERTGCPAF